METTAKTPKRAKTSDDPDLDEQYRHPMEVVYHERLAACRKLAILSRWASNACSLSNAPLMRRDPRTGLIARLDEIADALHALDEEMARRARLMSGIAEAAPRLQLEIGATSDGPPQGDSEKARASPRGAAAPVDPSFRARSDLVESSDR